MSSYYKVVGESADWHYTKIVEAKNSSEAIVLFINSFEVLFAKVEAELLCKSSEVIRE